MEKVSEQQEQPKRQPQKQVLSQKSQSGALLKTQPPGQPRQRKKREAKVSPLDLELETLIVNSNQFIRQHNLDSRNLDDEQSIIAVLKQIDSTTQNSLFVQAHAFLQNFERISNAYNDLLKK